MNSELIKTLAKRVDIQWDDKYHWYVTSNDMVKFAELIVDICRDLAEDGFHEEIDGQDINDKIARYFKG